MPARMILRSLVYALLVSASVIPFLILGGPVVGGRAAWTVYLVMAAVGYIVVIAPRISAGLRAGLLTAMGLTVLALVSPGGELMVVGGAAIVGMVRSGALYRLSARRALATELVLLAGGLLFARYLSNPSILGASLGLWGFFLVQALYGLFAAGIEPHGDGEAGGDPFARAASRAHALMDEPTR